MSARDRRLLPLMLNAIGMVVVAYAFFSGPFTAQHGVWLAFACVFALITWATVEILPWGFGPRGTPGSAGLRRVRRVAIFAGVIVASLSQAPTNAVHMAPLAIILILAISDEYESIWLGAAAAALAFALTPIGSVIAHNNLQAALSYEAGNAVWVLIGISRRQAQAASRQSRELLAQQQTVREQQAAAALLADRQAAARDIHDVLAHSLGGLVIQLDAAEALLESGRTADAHLKVTQAHRLAAEGLAEARLAVAELRSPDDAGPVEQAAGDLGAAAERLLRAHRELGGRVDARIDLSAAPQPIPAPFATAFERALQESLSNARRHAPGEAVAAELIAADGCLELLVSNAIVPGAVVPRPALSHAVVPDPADPCTPVPGPRVADAARGQTPPSRLGGGHGLTGMAERFAALPGGAVTAREQDGRFVVRAQARLADATAASSAPRAAVAADATGVEAETANAPRATD